MYVELRSMGNWLSWFSRIGSLWEEVKAGRLTKRRLNRASDVTRINPVREGFLC